MIRTLTLASLAAALACTGVRAQHHSAYDRRPRFQLAVVTTFPVGTFKYEPKENSLLGNARTTLGAETGISVPVFHGWTLGMFANYSHYKMADNGVLAFLQSRYADSKYYVTWPEKSLAFDVTQGAAECARNFRYAGIELEPYVRLGIGFHDGYSTLHIRRKMKGDNYEEQISLKPSGAGSNFFYPSLGMRANLPLSGWVYLVGGFQLMTGAMYTEVETVTTDIFGGRKAGRFVLKQNMTVFQVSLGLQMRAGSRKMY